MAAIAAAGDKLNLPLDGLGGQMGRPGECLQILQVKIGR